MKKLFAIALMVLLCGSQPTFAGTKLSRQQASAEIDSLVSLIEEVEVNPYMILPKEKFYAAVHKVKEGITTDSVSLATHFLNICRLTGMFQQGHLSPRLPDELRKDAGRYFTFGRMLKVNPATHELLTTADVLIDGDTIRRGSRLLSVNGRDVNDMIEDYLKLSSGETDAYRCSDLNSALRLFMMCENPSDKVFDIEFLSDGRKFAHRFTNSNFGSLAQKSNGNSPNKEPYSYRMLNDSVMLFSFNKCEMNGFEQFARRMFTDALRDSVRHLIIDVRENGGGNSATGDVICRYLTDRPFNGFGGCIAKISPRVRKHYAQFECDTIYDSLIDETEMHLPYDAKFRFPGKTYLLTSTYTYSSASNFAWEYWKFVPGTVIGEETGGVNISTGDVINETLPVSGISMMLPWKVFYHYGAKDGDPIHGTIPDIKVPAGEALDAALALIASGGGKTGGKTGEN